MESDLSRFPLPPGHLPTPPDLPGMFPPPPRPSQGSYVQDMLPSPPPFMDGGGFQRGRGRGRGRGSGGRSGVHPGTADSGFDLGMPPGILAEADRALVPPFPPPPGFGLPFRPEVPPPGVMMGMGWPGPGPGPGPGGGGLWGPPGGPMMAPGAMMMAAQRQELKPRDRWAATRVVDNDYCQHFVDTGERPQNFLWDSFAGVAFKDYPKLKELVEAKRALVQQTSTPAYALKADLSTLPLNVSTFGTRFDVIVMDPPWEEYARRNPEGSGVTTWPWDKIRDLAIPDVLDSQAFVFLWCGNEEAVEAGRHCFTKWGLHRIEDICWVKTNRNKKRKYLNAKHQRPETTLQHVKEHCLVGRKGDIQRKRDLHFVHTNIDVDIILSEEPELGSLQKPEELYEIIERFCLGRRRLELFGTDHNMREGWVTVGIDISVSNFNKDVYAAQFLKRDGTPYISTPNKIPKDGPHLLGTTDVIESLRPRSP